MMNEIINNRYQLLRVIGEGGYGKVWQAFDTQTGDEVALKIYKAAPFFIDEVASREYTLGHELSHPNILPVYEYIRDGSKICLVMPYCPHSSIYDMRGKLNEKAIWTIAKDIARGMMYLHDRGIVHLDIKLSNILQDTAGNYVLSDLGESQNLEELALSDYRNSRTIRVSEYMAPERRSSCRCVGPHSDIWSFGIALYELAYGQCPRLDSEGCVVFGDTVPRCEDTARLKYLIKACTMPYYRLRPSAEAILSFTEADEREYIIKPKIEIIRIADLKVTERDTLPGTIPNIRLEPVIDFEGEKITPIKPLNIELSEAVRHAMESYKVVKDEESSQYGIVDEDGNVLIDFVYDKIGEIEECYWPVGGLLGSGFIGAQFWMDDDTGYFKIFEDGSILEHHRCSNKEFAERLCWT